MKIRASLQIVLISPQFMAIISSKATIGAITEKLLATYNSEGIDAFISQLDKKILQQKVRFPVLEYAGTMLHNAIPSKKQLTVADQIIDLHQIGSNVFAGIILQLRLEEHFAQSIEKAIEYIITSDEWYVCDIIGERVMGHGLLTHPKKMLPTLHKLAKHENKWIVRCIGVAAHYAIKKGLKKEYVENVFRLLLSLSNTTDFHTKKGIGWAAKTTAKFHPDIIDTYRKQIDDATTKQWFKTKVKIGLSRTDKYAHRYNS